MKYVVWYITRSQKYTREIAFLSYAKAKSLYDALDRKEKALFVVRDGVYSNLVSA